MDNLVDKASGLNLSGQRDNTTSGESSAGGGGSGTGAEQEREEAFRSACEHYSRGCSFVSPCCGKVYPCRVCHDDGEPSHKIDRHAVTEVVCRSCNTRQLVSETCSSCEMKFARYFCPVCRLYDDKDKGQFHCEKCGLCRIGGRGSYFHCDTCGLCLPITIKTSHLCRQQSSHSNCPVCMEDIHTSRDTSHVPKCGHLLHTSCFQQMTANGLYQCPLCYTSLVDMTEKWKVMDREIDSWIMPTHLRDFSVKIQCRDCRQESNTLFHIVGLKCTKCNSFNTVRSGSEELPEDNGDQEAIAPGAMDFILRLIRREIDREQGEGEEEEEDEDEDGESDGEGGLDHDLLERLAAEAAQLIAGPPGGGEEEEEEEEEEMVGGGGGDEEGSDVSNNEDEEEEEEDGSMASSGGGYEDYLDHFDLPFAFHWNLGLSDDDEEEEEGDGDWPRSDDWSDSSSHPHHSDSSWETEEEEVIVGGAVDDPHDDRHDDSQPTSTLDGTQNSVAELVPDLPSFFPLALPSSFLGDGSYDTHIRLDQNGVTNEIPSEDSEGWETASEEVIVGGVEVGVMTQPMEEDELD